MGILRITEYGAIREAEGGLAQVPQEPSLARQKITFTTSTQSAPFNPKTRLIRLLADTDCFVSIGQNPTADANSTMLKADIPEYFGVRSNMKLAVYDGIS